jgi:hypothetical protein
MQGPLRKLQSAAALSSRANPQFRGLSPHYQHFSELTLLPAHVAVPQPYFAIIIISRENFTGKHISTAFRL